MRAHLRTIIILACTAGLLALFLRQANLADVWNEIQRASLWDLAGALLMTALMYVVRAWRWRSMLLPLATVRFSTAFRTTVIGFAANSLLPARAGEVLRPYLLARREGLSAAAAFATILLERLLDLVTVLLLFAGFVVLADPATTHADPALYRTVQVGGLLAGIGSLAGLVFVFVAAGHPERLGRLTRRAEHVLPASIAHALAHLVERFAGGFAVIRHPAPLVRALFLSLPLWCAIALGIWFAARAFHITMSFPGTFLIIMLLTVGVAVPTPGAVGGFHYAFRVGATAFFGAPNERAVGAAIVLHAISFVPVTLLGLVFMVQDGMNLGRLRHLARDAATEPAGADVALAALPSIPGPAVSTAVPDGSSPAVPARDDERAKA
jgi:uncharacterized protein (TIRG00374 family)